VKEKVTMVRKGIIDAWDDWTNFCPAQEFMDTGRAQGHPTIGAAVDAYFVEIPGMWREWAGLNADELEEIRGVLMSYFHLTRGIDWSWLPAAKRRESP
jgi:hypothetical protein